MLGFVSAEMDIPHHLRQAFDDSLRELEHDLLEMGSFAEAMVAQAVESLVRLDHELAIEVIERDDAIDEKDVDIESRCLRLLALQQPMGTDLRVIGTAMKVIADIERIGDLAVDIAKCGLKIEKELGSTEFIDIRKMSNVARLMLVDSLQAFVKHDLELVQEICSRDDEVDELYRQLREQIHNHMRTHPDEVVSASWMLLAIHHVERIADHATNIAERVHFMVTGKLEQIAKSHQTDQAQ
ncbi:MAG: phosphate signaling complex protein PhoU [Fimbriimonadaceae bacterium]|nr:phosphate signaling complex protein PhoU [Fimbriimonadaceae bacterium]